MDFKNYLVPGKTGLLIGIGGTTRPGSSTERALAAALAHARTLGAQTQLFGGAELAALPPFTKCLLAGLYRIADLGYNKVSILQRRLRP